MAIPLPHFSFSPSKITFPKPKYSHSPLPITFGIKPLSKATNLLSNSRNYTIISKASKDEEATTTADENTAVPPEDKSQNEEIADLGAEIKKAMKERQQKEEAGFLSGVGEEIREIEWPAFNKVLGTTGVVLGVIAGSSVVLLTVNAILAEISDRIFAGKGVQDFFG